MLSKFILKKTSSGSATDEYIIAEHIFDGSLFTIGSDAASTIVLPEAAAEQAVVIQEKDHLTLFNRSDGTALNSRELRRESMEPLAHGDEIKIGGYVIKLFAAGYAVENGNSRAAVANAAAKDIFTTSEDIAVAHLPEIQRENKTFEKNKPELPSKKNARNFADILNTLRTEEDSFYFIVENGRQEERRIPLEHAEMPLGLDAKGEISGQVEKISSLYAILRKDWSGIVIETQRGGAVFVNDEAVTTTRRLRNGDRVSFNTLRQNDKTLPFLRLHEPSSLVALESLLETRSRAEGANVGTNSASVFYPNEIETTVAPDLNESFLERRFLGYFSFFEIASMIIGTLIGAVLIFLLLEFFVG
jgi:pSer/pThr/pTyr-binding forkhead associated (FHA) protein